MLALVIPALRQAEAATDISIDFFYDNLGSGGNWVEVADYGYCWQPTVAVSNSSWRPYSDGYWAYTDVGWTWVSYEDFGWATYHYGRWTRLRDRGWYWVPGREWGPSWVSWRTGGDYVGWAPLPPRGGGEAAYESRPITAQVDVEFDIGPAYYNFIDVRYIGEPVLRERIFAPDQNVTYITKTVNVTNITYNNSTVYNYGPDYNTLNRYSARPVQRLTLQRETNVDPSAAARSNSLMKVQGDRLVIAAPSVLQKAPATVAPKVVKEKIAKPNIEHGWSGVSDPKAQAELKQKMKAEDPKRVPPPSIKPRDGAETMQSPASSPATSAASATPAATARPLASASPAASVSPSTSASPTISPAKDKNKRPESVSPAPSASASASAHASPAMTPDKNKDKRNEKVSPLPTSSASVAPGRSPGATRDKGKNKERENAALSASLSPSSSVTKGATPSAAPKQPAAEKQEKDKRKNKPAITPPASSASGPAEKSAAPSVAPQPRPESKRKSPEPAKPETKNNPMPEKPRIDAAAKPEAKPQKNPPVPQERVSPPPGPAKDAPKKKNEPASSPTPG
jgi:hypothetical protein